VPTRTYYHPQFGTLFEPTFDPAGCYWKLPYLGSAGQSGFQPRVAIFTLTYNRLELTKKMLKTMTETADYPFDWFVVDNGSTDGTQAWLKKRRWIKEKLLPTNLGISSGSNLALEMIFEGAGYDIIGKVDNDCEFQTCGWLRDIVDLWKRNRMLYISPYPEGLVANPGGGPRIGGAELGPYFVEVAQHLGGLCVFIDASAYKDFRWQDKFLHGNQDAEASLYFRKNGYMPLYLSKHRVLHNTEEQLKAYPEYFERRKVEKQTQA
jgi:GT2 family glycosyltransferase